MAESLISGGEIHTDRVKEMPGLIKKGLITKAEAKVLLEKVKELEDPRLKDLIDEMEELINGTKKLIDDAGKFIDDVLESGYQKYLQRKTKEGKVPKDRLGWKEARDYWLYDSPMARGNAFNKTAEVNEWYPYNEVHLENGKRLDSYDPINGEIISRKATDLSSIEMSTFEKYLSELQAKYAPGTKIRSNKYIDSIDGMTLEGKFILEIPDSNQSLSNIQEFIDLAKNKYDVEIRFRGE